MIRRDLKNMKKRRAAICFLMVFIMSFTLLPSGPRGVLYGPTTQAVTVHNDLGVGPPRFFVEFRPGGLFAFTGIPQWELSDRTWPLEDAAPELYVMACGAFSQASDLDDFAARMDGAKSIKRFWHVTLPQLRPTIFFLSVTTIIDVFKTFDEVYIMYGNEAGPLKSGLTIVYYIFTKFYRHWEFSSAAAAAFILFLIILCITLAQFVIVKVYRLCKEARDCE